MIRLRNSVERSRPVSYTHLDVYKRQDFLYKITGGGERALLDQVADRLKGCDLNFVAPSDEQESILARRLTAGFGNLSEAIRQAVALSVQIAEAVPPICILYTSRCV